MDSSKKGGGVVMLVVVLGMITFFCALILSVMHQFTLPKIEENTMQIRSVAMEALIPGAEFEAMEVPEALRDPESAEHIAISDAYKATIDGGEAGYCIEVHPSGFDGEMEIFVGIDVNNRITGIKVIAHSETPGLGAKAQTDADFGEQFIGQPADSTLKMSGDGGTIDAITGATITSQAVVNGVNRATEFAAALN